MTASDPYKSSTSVRPIIVVGMIRSGTKWVCNLIGNSSEIVVPQDSNHGGVIETNMFFHFERAFGPLTNPDGFAATVSLWPKTDLYRATNLPVELPRSLTPKPIDHFELYDRCMCHWAEQVESRYWLQKTAPGFLPRMAQHLRKRDAKIIIVRRDSTSTLHSLRRHNQNKGRNVSATRLAISICIQNKLLDRLSKQFPESMVVSYQALEEDKSKVLQSVCEYLRIDFDENMLATDFRANSSFKGGSNRNVGMGTRAAMKSTELLTHLCPQFVLTKLQSKFGGRATPFLSGTFSGLTSELASDTPS